MSKKTTTHAQTAEVDTREAMLEQLGIKDKVFFIPALDGYYFNRQVPQKLQRALLGYQTALDEFLDGKQTLSGRDQLQVLELQRPYFEFAAEILTERFANVGKAAPSADDLEERFSGAGIMNIISIFLSMDGDPNV